MNYQKFHNKEKINLEIKMRNNQIVILLRIK